MSYTNHAMLIRRELVTQLGKLFLEDRVAEEIDRIPINMRPRNGFNSRCCVYKDRAVLKYKMMALLGFNIQDEEDELKPLSAYYNEAKKRTRVSSRILTVVDEACTQCVKVNYEVTNLCRGCVGRPCVLNCPKDAITLINGKAVIDHAKCINCGKCQKACPYSAIIYQPIPCETACPVGAISKNEKGVEHIDKDKCIHCGKCVTSCPFGAIVEKTHLVEIFEMLKQGKRLIALPAPSIIGQFKTDYNKIRAAIKALGFADIYEVAKGANETTANETAEFLEKMEEGQAFMTTSCCPAYVQTVDKHVPELKPFVSHTKTPMHYAAKAVKEKDPEAIVVFLGPCTAKRSEAFYDDYVDYTLSFEVFAALLEAKEIDICSLNGDDLKLDIQAHGFGFGKVGGVSQSIRESLPEGAEFDHAVVDGIDKAQVKLFKTYAKGKHPAKFIEVMSCEGGCVGGPNVILNPKVAGTLLQKYVQSSR